MSDGDTSNNDIRKPRTLVLCFDGTSNQFDDENTNVVKLFALLKKDDFQEQLCYYQAGVGTYFKPGVVSPLFGWAAAVLDEAIAWYLDQHVMDGYEFLMQNYRVGDKICLFGFSRGAYTARALAGMLLKVGLLPRDNQQQIAFAYKLFKSTSSNSDELAAGFKETFCQSVQIEFVGVWDTVASVGVVMGRSLPFVESNRDIKTFRHALSLDEHRAKFRPNLYHRPGPNAKAVALDPEHASPVVTPSNTTEGKTASAMKPWSVIKKEKREQEQKEGDTSTSRFSLSATPQTDVLEVWFSGCHSDVGGGAVPDDTQLSLAEITLRWMVREVMASECGIQFDENALARMKVPTTTFPPATSTSAGPVELELDAKDATQPLHDQLKIKWIWWLLEIIPLTYTWQDMDGVWHKKFECHLGKGRLITDARPNFHVTVKQRMSDAALKYKPKACYSAGSENYVE
ncbi:hypothetical protein PLICRDRAFT_107215 [Plicaturopsis crispa FD-325 SS-3]|nr:hypothetical protein PLICRDRAFT_107215 [Plicaturopsis crispa FD-325 SS-3]